MCVCAGVGSGGKVPERQHASASTCLHGDVVFSDFWIRNLQLRFRTTLQIPSKDLQYGGQLGLMCEPVPCHLLSLEMGGEGALPQRLCTWGTTPLPSCCAGAARQTVHAVLYQTGPCRIPSMMGTELFLIARELPLATVLT